MYGNDFDGFVIPSYQSVLGGWPTVMEDLGYLSKWETGKYRIINCQVNTSLCLQTDKNQAEPWFPWILGTYGYSTRLNSPDYSNKHKFSYFKKPSQKFILADKVGIQFSNGACYTIQIPTQEVWPIEGSDFSVANGGFSFKHGNRTNLLFVDGHSESLGISQIPTPQALHLEQEFPW